MVYVVALQEPGELIGHEGRAVISVDKARKSVMGDRAYTGAGSGNGQT